MPLLLVLYVNNPLDAAYGLIFANFFHDTLVTQYFNKFGISKLSFG